jgi:hypothetical protein
MHEPTHNSGRVFRHGCEVILPIKFPAKIYRSGENFSDPILDKKFTTQISPSGAKTGLPLSLF